MYETWQILYKSMRNIWLHFCEILNTFFYCMICSCQRSVCCFLIRQQCNSMFECIGAIIFWHEKCALRTKKSFRSTKSRCWILGKSHGGTRCFRICQRWSLLFLITSQSSNQNSYTQQNLRHLVFSAAKGIIMSSSMAEKRRYYL